MAVLAASICTRGGKPLLSRQFRDLSQDRITALLANFPSLISNALSQHTTVEDDEVRYVYQPVEELYVVLITNKTSNILADIDTLHLFVLTVLTMLRQVDDREVFDNSFEIISAFDEIVNLGFKENLTLSQVQLFLEMDSHEEKIQEIIERNKELEAAEERKRKAKEIQRRELAKRTTDSQLGAAASAYGGYSSPTPTYQAAPIVEPVLAEPAPSKFAGGLARGPSKGGLQLGKKNGRVHHTVPASAASAAPAEAQPLLLTAQPVFKNQQPASPVVATPPVLLTPNKSINNGILLSINEKVSAQLSRDGLVELSEIKGVLQLRINNPDYADAKILLETDPKVQFKTHPNVDKQLFAQQLVISSRAFPVDDRSLGVLRWRVVGGDGLDVPLSVTAWVNIDEDVARVTLEYELTLEYSQYAALANLALATVTVPVVADVSLDLDVDGLSFDITDEGVVFTLPPFTQDHQEGLFEFSVPGVQEEDDIFPLQVGLDIESTKEPGNQSRIGVKDVVSGESLLPFDLNLHVQAETYQVN